MAHSPRLFNSFSLFLHDSCIARQNIHIRFVFFLLHFWYFSALSALFRLERGVVFDTIDSVTLTKFHMNYRADISRNALLITQTSLITRPDNARNVTSLAQIECIGRESSARWLRFLISALSCISRWMNPSLMQSKRGPRQTSAPNPPPTTLLFGRCCGTQNSNLHFRLTKRRNLQLLSLSWHHQSV